MNSHIRSYDDLLVEKARLQSLLSGQKKVLRDEVDGIMEKLEPLESAIAFAGKLTTRDHSNIILNAGADKLIDLVVKKILLSKAGWITRLIVPLLLKNYSSHAISDSKDAILKKLFSLFSKKNVNGQEKVHAD